MSRKWIIVVSLVAAGLVFYFAARIVWHGFLQGIGCFSYISEWSTSGQRLSLEGVNIWGQRFGACYYWKSDGRVDLERSGWFDSDDRVRPLSSADLADCTPEHFVGPDLVAIVFAESIHHCRHGRCVADSDLFADRAWSDATGKRNPRPLDPWGRPYQVTLTHAGDGVVAACLGRDGVEGGTGADADQEYSWDISMGHMGGDRW